MKLHPWQTDMLTKLKGVKAGELMIISSGRQLGKSNVNAVMQEWQEYMAKPFRHLGEATVDGEKWYTVNGQKRVCQWIRTQDQKFWFEHIDDKWNISYNTFDVHERIYTMMGMKF